MYHDLDEIIDGLTLAPHIEPKLDFDDLQSYRSDLYRAYMTLKESNAPRFLLNLFCRPIGEFNVKIDFLPNGNPGPVLSITRPDLIRTETIGTLMIDPPEEDGSQFVSLSFAYPAIADPEENMLCTIGLHQAAITLDMNAPSDMPRSPSEAAYRWDREAWSDIFACEQFLEETGLSVASANHRGKDATDCFYSEGEGPYNQQ